MFLIGIEAIGWLVENKNLRVMQDGLGEPDSPLVSFGQRFSRLSQDGIDMDALNDLVDSAAFFRSFEPADVGDEV